MSIDLIDFKLVGGRIQLDETGDFILLQGAERVRQQLEFLLSLWQGEWFLDTDFGMPYRRSVLNKLAENRLTLDAAVGIIREKSLEVPGVLAVLRFDYSFDIAERKLTIDAEWSSEFGIIQYTNRV